MKAKSFLLGLCALALAACSIDETTGVNDTNAISFKATTATRATATTTNNIMEFSVWAWNTADGNTNEFMDDVIASRSGTSNTFTTFPLYFWPTGTVDFYAVSPATELYGVETDTNGNQVEYAYFGGELNEGDDEDPTWTYEGYVAKAQIENDNIVFDVTIPSKAEDQIDLCYAINKDQSSGGVKMNFRHALSQVVFKAKNVNEDFVVDIAGVSVCSVFKTGTYTLKGVESTIGDITVATDDSKGVWDYDNEDHKARFVAGVATTNLTYEEGGEAVSIMTDDGALMLLPQTVEKWDVYADLTDSALGSYIAVLCRVTEHGSLLWPNANEENHTELVEGFEYAYIAMPVEVEWEEGYRYTYTIIFGEGLGYYPPDDDAFDLEGTPVLVPITFDVTVDEFQDAEGVEVSTEPEPEPEPLVLEYTIDTDGTEIELPLGERDLYSNEFAIDCTVDWGDGSEVETVKSKHPSHIYSVGIYNVIINGKVELLNSGDYDKMDYINGVECLTAVKQWGDTELRSMDSAFYGCSNLASLPEEPGPFSNVTSFYWAFGVCTSLTTLPENMLSNCTSATDFYGAFCYCSSLTSVPENLFANCPLVKDFEAVFFGCTSMTSVPENLFANCPSVESFDIVFCECTSLETVPVGIFNNNKSVTYFQSAFENCSSLVGESPYTMIDGNKVHLYERENYPEYFIAPEYYEDCFMRCTGLDDYYSIPYSWGGPEASHPPVSRMSLSTTDREERGPSRLGSHRDATRSHPTRK